MKKRFPIPPHLYDAWFSSPRGKKILEAEISLVKKMIWPSRGTLLDIGCGTGIFTSLFKELGFSTMGLDLSREMLLHYRKKDPRVPLIQGDGQILPVRTQALHYASLITVLEFLDHPFFALVEAIRVASRGILIAFLPPWAPTNIKRRIKGTLGVSSFRQASFLSFSTLKIMVKEACRINSKEITGMEVDGCLFPGGVPLLPLASFAVVRVDYE